VEARLADPRHWGALELLLDEAGFLLGARAGSMIARLPTDERGLVQARCGWLAGRLCVRWPISQPAQASRASCRFPAFGT
jgi:hypothetical protein